MWVLTIIILKDIKCFQIWAYFERLGINFNFENFQNKIFPFFHFKNHPKYACTISPDVGTFVKNRGLVCLHFIFTEMLKIVAESG
jgi:hypothetical protein